MVSNEKWMAVEGFVGQYEISDLGVCRSLPREEIVFRESVPYVRHRQGRGLKAHLDHSGYFRVVLCKNSAPHNFLLHRLVAKAFIANPAHKPEVNHRDAIKTHNHVSNLEWVTKAEHESHSLTNGLKPCGSRQGLSKLTEKQVSELRKLSDKGRSSKLLAHQFDVSQSNVRRIVRGNGWLHVRRAKNEVGDTKGARNGRAKLTDKKIIEIRKLRAHGWTLQRLADSFGISFQHMGLIVSGQRWSHVPMQEAA